MTEPTQYYNPKQIIALQHLSPRSDIEVVLFGGAASVGKSWLGCEWQLKRRLVHAGTVGIIGRSELKKLQLSTMITFWRRATEIGLKAGTHYIYNAQYNTIKFSNGSMIFLMDMADMPSDPDFQRFGSMEITDYFIDEAAEVSEKAMNILDSRVRYKLVKSKPKGLMTCNPAKGWLYQNYYGPHRDGRLDSFKAFVPALPTDNPYTDPVYLEKLARLPETDRKRLLEGDWDYDESKDRIFDYNDLMRAFELPMTSGQMYTTADIAAMGDDETIIGVWSGLSLTHIYKYRQKLPHEVAALISEINTRHSVPTNNTIVDSDGLGIGVQGILRCQKFLNGGKSVDSERYENMRSECYYKLAELMRVNQISFHVQSERTTIIQELDAIRRKNMHSERKLSVISRDEIIKTLGHSPDMASMIMMRMFFELRPNYGKYAFSW
jgi:hypothetical protein